MKISSLSANPDFLQYCGPECQKSHWTMHKPDCKSHLGRESWQPGWALENRAPAFSGNGPPQVTYGAGKYLWGNFLAFDVLRLSANEGASYDEQLRLLFATSRDLQNVIKTIAQLPDSYTQPIEVTINNRDLNIVARNVIMLLISLIVNDVDVAAEGGKDYCDRHLLLQSPSHRIALTRFCEDGLLLPFGAARDAFRHPNPTIYQAASWPMYDNADPLNRWSAKDVQETQTGPATADIYGKLFISLRAVLRAFLRRLSSSQTSFRLFHMDASALPGFLENSTFSRIEVSNISDAGYLGIHHTLDLMIPLLQSPLVNPHATLITLFMNAVDENATEMERLTDMKADGMVMKRIHKYLSLSGRPLNYYDTTIFKIMAARDCVPTYDHVFDWHAAKLMVSQSARLVGAAMKGSRTVIEKWPFRLKLRPGQTGAQEGFDRLLGGGVSSKERYVEWKRV
ncbi:hypothetical protein K4K60_010030 [Colletotrichum sp. SAR11_57]|nr:hypothetical protein K4K60_010030 [Colletotrichum sp. SAR11_57]